MSPPAVRGGQLRFTHDWFSKNIPIWEEHVLPFAGRENYSVLEVGSWEGRSACWLLEHVLTHPTARLTCVDTWGGCAHHDLEDVITEVEKTFDRNIAAVSGTAKVTKVKGPSQHVLRGLPLQLFDLVYIDASHLAPNVLTDAVLCWELLKDGGMLIFDDYQWKSPAHDRKNPLIEPKIAIDAFLRIFGPHLHVIEKGRQMLATKRSSCSVS